MTSSAFTLASDSRDMRASLPHQASVPFVAGVVLDVAALIGPDADADGVGQLEVAEGCAGPPGFTNR